MMRNSRGRVILRAATAEIYSSNPVEQFSKTFRHSNVMCGHYYMGEAGDWEVSGNAENQPRSLEDPRRQLSDRPVEMLSPGSWSVA